MAWQLGLMVLGSLLIGGGAMLGIEGLHQDLGIAVGGYRELRQVYEVGLHVAQAKEILASDHPDTSQALAAIETAQVQLDLTDYGGEVNVANHWLDESQRDQCRELIAAAVAQLQKSDPTAIRAQSAAVNDILGELAALSTRVRRTIIASQESAARNRLVTMEWILALSVIVIIGAIFVGVRQYRGVVGPLDRLGQGVRRFAAGHLSMRLGSERDREFVSLANDFNRMADELEALYLDLEKKVQIKSQELARSQRLASVGYLAAGVAHEINNPLSIITGYGEHSLKLLDRTLDDAGREKTRETIRIICDEAFRCKGITNRLLSLARPGSEQRRPVCLRQVAADVIGTLGGLPENAGRQLTLQADADQDFHVVARDGEMKQVILNLLLNALDAVPALQGCVDIRLMRSDDAIELTVSDNGSGMTPQILERIFEPFFTDKRSRRHGAGLGLPITHAIVANHGGAIRAQSDGVGRGSRFVVTLPAAHKGAQVAGR